MQRANALYTTYFKVMVRGKTSCTQSVYLADTPEHKRPTDSNGYFGNNNYKP
jgi:hypothetical protein